MNIIQAVILWVHNHWADIGMIWLQVIGIASIIVQLTPTLKDDDVLKNLIRFVGKYIALNTDKGKTITTVSISPSVVTQTSPLVVTQTFPLVVTQTSPAENKETSSISFPKTTGKNFPQN